MSDQETTPSRPASPLAPLPDFTSARPYRFNWDASNRRAGPGSVATSEGRGDYITPNPRLDLFNMSSASLLLGSMPQEWSSSKHGFHAISNVLNNPHKRQAPPKAHAPVPPVTPSSLPRVRRKDFEPYLTAITPEWEQFEKNTMLGREGFASLEGPSTSGSNLDFGDMPMTPRSARPPPRTALPPLDTIPPVYFERNFNLADARTFNAVLEEQGGNITSLDPSSSSQPVMERLSHYADTVELHLINEISLRSSSFFAALHNLRDLQTESQQCLSRITELRTMLKDVDDKSAKRGLQVVQKEMKLKNLASVQEGIKTVAGVSEVMSVAKGLVAAGEWGEALNVIEGIRNLWDTEVSSAPPTADNGQPQALNHKPSLSTVPESPTLENGSAITPSFRPIPLSSLQAFASLPVQLDKITSDISAALTSDLTKVLQVELETLFEPNSDPQRREDASGGEAFKDRLRPLLQGLKRIKGLKQALLALRDIVMLEIKRAEDKHLPCSNDLDDDETAINDLKSGRGADLRPLLQSMSQPDFMTLIKAIFSSMLAGIQGLQSQNATIVELLDPTPGDISADILSAIQTDLSEILSSAIELSHSRIAKVIACRTEQHASLDLIEFLQIFSETWSFVISTETIGRRMIVGLRGVIVSQAKAFLQNFHSVRISQSAKFVEDEVWNSAEITPPMQNVANVLVDSAVRDPPELMYDQTITQTDDEKSVSTNGVKSPSSKHLYIEDRRHFAVPATLKTLELLVDYIRVIINLSLLTTDAISRIMEFLKSFNSRTCQVVLGAGAMRSAGLRNITAKHLALASQSLAIIISLIPYVRECFRRHLNPKQAVMLTEFDKLKRDYQEHQNEVHAKLIAIMGDRLSVHCKTLQTINFEAPRDTVNDYMELLVKETSTLHKVLSRYLPDQVVEYIMSQVVAAINHRLSQEYSKFELQSPEAKDRMLRDVRFLVSRLQGLKNVGAITSMLETIVTEKSIPRKNGAENGVTESTNDRIKNLLARSTVGSVRNSFRSSTIPAPAAANGSTPVTEKDKEKETVVSPPPVPEKVTHNLELAPSPSPAASPQPPPQTYPTEKTKALSPTEESGNGIQEANGNGDDAQMHITPRLTHRPLSDEPESISTSVEKSEQRIPGVGSPELPELPNGDSAQAHSDSPATTVTAGDNST